MTPSNSSAICGYKGIVQARHTDADGQLRIECAADLIADALDGFVAARRGPAENKGNTPQAPRAKPVAMQLARTDGPTLKLGEIASCWLSMAEDASNPRGVNAELRGPHGAAWRATVQLAHDLPAPVPGSLPNDGTVEAAAARAPASDWPPLRLMRSMRKSHCDQAGHVNVQVFMDLADEAATVVGLEGTGGASGLEIVQARISFKRELFEGDVVAVHSGIRQVADDGMQVVHGIVHQPSGALACVVETRLAVSAQSVAGAAGVASAPAAIAPAERVGDWPSLPLARPPAEPRAGAEPSAEAVTTSLSVVDAWDADASGRLSARALIGLCSTGARQYLAAIGLTGARFLREQITVAAVDYLVDIQRRPTLGSNLALRSAFLSGSAKSIRFSHHLVDTDDGTRYATIEIVGVMLDLKSHRSMEVPRDVRERLDMATD